MGVIDNDDGSTESLLSDNLDSGDENMMSKDDDNVYTVDECLDLIGIGYFQVWLLCLCGIGFASGTVELVLVTLLYPSLHRDWPEVGSLQYGYLSTITFISEIVGSLFWGWFSDKYGRKFVFWGTAGFGALFSLASAFAPSFIWLLVLRFCFGFALGGSLSQDFMMLMEFLPSKHRGRMSCLIVAFGVGGVLTTALLGWLTLIRYGWRVYLVMCSLPTVLCFFGRCFWKMESPRYLLVIGDTKKALEVLHYGAKKNKVQLPPNLILAPVKQSQENGRILALFRSKRDTLVTLCISMVWFCQSFAYYGVTIWLSKYLQAKGLRETDIYLSLAYMGLCQIPSLAIVSYLIDVIGRKYCLFISLVGCAISSFCSLFAETQVASQLCFCALYFFVVGGWTSIYIITPELFPTSLRGTAYGVTGVFSTVGGMTTGMVGGLLFHYNVQPSIVLTLYSSVFLLGGLCGLTLPNVSSDDHLYDIL